MQGTQTLFDATKIQNCMFIMLNNYVPLTVILKWLVDDAVVEKAIQTDCLIKEEEVECRPERVQNSILDENVDVCLIRKYFTNDAWKVVQDVLQLKEINTTWTCQICHSDVMQA